MPWHGSFHCHCCFLKFKIEVLKFALETNVLLIRLFMFPASWPLMLNSCLAYMTELHFDEALHHRCILSSPRSALLWPAFSRFSMVWEEIFLTGLQKRRVILIRQCLLWSSPSEESPDILAMARRLNVIRNEEGYKYRTVCWKLICIPLLTCSL